MLDLHRLEQLELTADPLGQKCVALALLAPNYWTPPRVDIEFEHLDRLPDEPVVFAMNHTDRYNYWPFQFQLWWERDRFTASWVKGKYYQNELIGRFLEWTDNIPTVSRGFIIARDFMNVTGRRPEEDEYAALRDFVDASADHGDESFDESRLAVVPKAILDESRHVLGLHYDANHESYGSLVDRLFRRMMRRFVELNGEALDKGLDLLVFPEGTRSVQLQRGRIGLAQIALHFDATVVPVGCNGSDRLYPGDSPIARGGRVVYRFGEPLGESFRSKFTIDEEFQPFTAEAEEAHRETFQAFVDALMERINGLLDPRHRFEDTGADSRSAERFV